MKKIFTPLLVLSMVLSHLTGKAAEAVGSLMFVANMTGTEAVPIVSTNAKGLAVFILNSTHDTLCITISLSGIDDITGIYIQEGTPGTQGVVVLDLSPYRENNQVFANITGAALSTALIKNMLSGKYYINAGSPAYIDGEIRGQILPETNETYVIRLDGATALPANTSPGVGLGVFVLSSDKKSIRFTVLARNMTGVVSTVQLHTSLLGLAGPVVLNLTQFLSGSIQGKAYLSNTIDSSLLSDYPTFLLNLRSGFIYARISSDAYPTGELRGQLIRERNIGFYAMLSPLSEIPPVVSSGLGLAYFSFNATFDTLRYDAVTGGLSGTPLHARVRAGDANTIGPILTDLDYGLQGDTNILAGYASDTSVNLNLLRDMLSGNAYLNIATLLHPTGEMRGQLQTTQRSGYSYRMTGAQETPAVESDAYGSGFMSVGPDSTDARFMFLYGGLSSPAVGAHFHVGGAGQLGPVVFNVTPYITNDNFVMGNWLVLDTLNSFTTILFGLLNHDSLYLNLRTLQYPNGEIRGQLTRGLICNLFTPDSSLSVQPAIDHDRALNVYPNPLGTDQDLTVRYVSPNNARGTLAVYDMMGRKVTVYEMQIDAGTNFHSIDMTAVAPGIYSVSLTVGDKNLVQLVAKQ
ncbi:MAG TPA: CHRD domain-containing protein [Chitinophagales bacterium]|nr:CHRD domain-containing protein [Chitinophagales bacterium]